jgi:hypothetical protein
MPTGPYSVATEIDGVRGVEVVAWKDVGDTVQAFVTAGGIVVGGIFTYYKFFKDRIYRPRLDLIIEAERVSLGDKRVVLACRVTIHNMGATKLSLEHDGTALVVRSGTAEDERMHVTHWSSPDDSAVVDVFAKHEWIESTETIRDAVSVTIDPDPAGVYRVELDVVVGHPSPWSKRNITITGAAMVAGVTQPPGTGSTGDIQED